MLTSFPVTAAATARGEIPRAARKYLPQVVREAHYQNIDPPVAAGQIHQESRWDSSAASPFASGLAQFTPETEAWAKSAFPRLKDGAGSLDPRWAIRAMCTYDRWLLDRTDQRYAAALRAYNGGLGWLRAEAALEHTKVCPTGEGAADCAMRICRRFRAASSCKENLAYPERILNIHAPMYRAIINPFSGES